MGRASPSGMHAARCRRTGRALSGYLGFVSSPRRCHPEAGMRTSPCSCSICSPSLSRPSPLTAAVSDRLAPRRQDEVQVRGRAQAPQVGRRAVGRLVRRLVPVLRRARRRDQRRPRHARRPRGHRGRAAAGHVPAVSEGAGGPRRPREEAAAPGGVKRDSPLGTHLAQGDQSRAPEE